MKNTAKIIHQDSVCKALHMKAVMWLMKIKF